MRCLITGVAGFVGSSLADQLLSDGHSVTGVDCFVDYYPRAAKERNLAKALRHPQFRFQEANLATVELDPLLKDVEWIFHQAGQAGVRASWGGYFNSYCEHNIIATQRLLEACKGRQSVKKIVFASSSSVYGNAESFPTSERAVPQPVSPYGVTKLAAEHLMSLYDTEFGVPTASLRYFTVFGPRQRPDMAFHRFIKAALKKEEITLYGDGEQARDFTFISDIVQANILAAQVEGARGVFNIGGGCFATVNDVLRLLNELVGPFNVSRQDRQKGDAKRTSADTTRAKSILGFKPQVDLRTGLSREIEWLREITVA